MDNETVNQLATPLAGTGSRIHVVIIIIIILSARYLLFLILTICLRWIYLPNDGAKAMAL